MSNSENIKIQFQEEQEYIQTLTDTTEAALRGNRLQLKIQAFNGTVGAASELVKVEKCLNDYLAQKNKSSDIEWFENSTAAGRWMVSQGYLKKSGGGIITEDAARKFVDTLRKDKKGYSAVLVKRAADNKYGSPTKPDVQIKEPDQNIAEQIQNATLRKIKASAEKQEIEVDNLKREIDRKWLYRDEAVENLAAIWAAVQQALDHAVHTASAAIILAANGDISRCNEVEEAIQETIIAKAFNEVANAKKIHIIFKDEKEE